MPHPRPAFSRSGEDVSIREARLAHLSPSCRSPVHSRWAGRLGAPHEWCGLPVRQGSHPSFMHGSIRLCPPGVCRAPDLPAVRRGQVVRDGCPCGFAPADHPAAAGAGGGAAAAPGGERGRSGEGTPGGSRYCLGAWGGRPCRRPPPTPMVGLTVCRLRSLSGRRLWAPSALRLGAFWGSGGGKPVCVGWPQACHPLRPD